MIGLNQHFKNCGSAAQVSIDLKSLWPHQVKQGIRREIGNQVTILIPRLFGITEPGESWKAVEEGWLEIDGKHPINPSGGLIGAGHPVGATGTRQLLDAHLQVTGQAGDYQVPGARTVQTLNIGGSGTTSCSFVVGV